MDVLEKHVNDQISGIYESGSQTLPCNELTFIRKPNKQTLQLPFEAKQQWLELVQVAMT